jgi:hypothetical protein
VGCSPSWQNASYQIVLQDFGKLVFCTSGTNTYTLPAAADLPDGWFCRLRNRSGVNLTLNPTGADTLNGSAIAGDRHRLGDPHRRAHRRRHLRGGMK